MGSQSSSLTVEKQQARVLESVSETTSLAAAHYLQGDLGKVREHAVLHRVVFLVEMEMSRVGWKWLCLMKKYIVE